MNLHARTAALALVALVALTGCTLSEIVDAIRVDHPGWCDNGTPVDVDGQILCEVWFDGPGD